MIEEGLRTRLVSQVAAVSGRVFPVILPQSVDYPAITYATVADTRSYTMDGPDGLVEQRIRIIAWSPSYADMRTITETVRTAMADFQGSMGGTSVALFRHLGGPDLYDDETRTPGDNTPGVHYSPQEYAVYFDES